MNSFRKSKIFIATLDPYNKGGVLIMTKFVYKNLIKNGYDVRLVYNIVPSLRFSNNKADTYGDITLFKLLLFKKPKIRNEEIFDMNGFGIERVLPEFEFFNYILNISLWKKVLDDGDIFFAIGGNNLCALPFVILRKKFSIWVASTLYEDRIDRIRKEKFLRKIRDYASLPFLLFFEKLIFRKANVILALSNYTKDQILRKFNLDPNKVILVPMPIDTEKFYPLDYKLRKNDYLLFVGRFSDKRKNIFLLLKAFRELKRKYSYLKLKLIGDVLTDEIKKFLEENNLNSDIEILPFINNEELVKYYQNALLFIIPSFQEGLCIAGLEAMACGIPVISTKCGGPEDYIITGFNGFLVKNNDLNDLITAIDKFLNLTESKKIEMCNNARETILKKYSHESLWPIFLKIFQNGF